MEIRAGNHSGLGRTPAGGMLRGDVHAVVRLPAGVAEDIDPTLGTGGRSHVAQIKRREQNDLAVMVLTVFMCFFSFSC